jgi:hypothetical protein
MKKIIAALFGLVVLATAAPAVAVNSNPHPGWQHNPRNPHYVKPTPHCAEWAMLNQLGSPAVCIRWS